MTDVADPFHTVLGDVRGTAAPEADTVLSRAPNARAKDHLKRLKANLSDPGQADPEEALRWLRAGAGDVHERPLLEGVRQALARWAVPRANAAVAPAFTALTDAAGLRDAWASAFLLGNGTTGPLHVWPDGHKYGSAGLAPEPLQMLCGEEVKRSWAQAARRGAWRKNLQFGNADRRCAACVALADRKGLADALGGAHARLVLDELGQEPPAGAGAVAPVPASMVEHLQRIVADRLLNPPQTADGLDAVARADLWAQMLHSACQTAEKTTAAVCDRARVPVSPRQRALIDDGARVSADDWRDALKLLCSGMNSVDDLAANPDWTGLPSDDAVERYRSHVRELLAGATKPVQP